MIHEHAETAADIARLLRAAQEPIVIAAPRQSGKTRELIKFAESKYSNSQFAVVCANHEIQRLIIKMHFNMISTKGLTKTEVQTELVARRLLGDKSILRDGEVNPPLMLTPGNVSNIRGRSLPIFCDEWNSLGVDVQEIIVNSGQFVAAVTS
jgi:hypothetical protein